MCDIMKEFWLGLFWFFTGYGLYTILLYTFYKSHGWKNTRRAFLWAGVGGFFFLGIIGQDSPPLLGGTIAAMCYVMLGIFVIKFNRRARTPYEERYKMYLQDKINLLKPTTEEWSKAKKALGINGDYEKNRRVDIERKWRELKLDELDDPFEWRLLYGEHSAERGGDIRAYEKKVQKGIIIGIALFVAVVISVTLVLELPKLFKYDRAIGLMNNGQLEEAQAIFLEMDEYRNAMAFYYCCKAQQDVEKGYFSSAHFDLYMVKQKYHLSPEKYPNGFNEELIQDINTGYDAYIKTKTSSTLARMNARSNPSTKKKTNQAKSNSYTKKRIKDTSAKKYDDPLNARAYDNSEDFYDDNYYDFFDYEEAEDYYYEHGGR